MFNPADWRIDNPQVSVQLLIFAVQTAITTLTCTVEMLSWEGYSRAEQLRLCGLYVPYLLLGKFDLFREFTVRVSNVAQPL